jgi:hypothetical protein
MEQIFKALRSIELQPIPSKFRLNLRWLSLSTFVRKVAVRGKPKTKESTREASFNPRLDFDTPSQKWNTGICLTKRGKEKETL